MLTALVSVDRKGAARADENENKVEATATIGVAAHERIDSLEVTLARALARIRVLERAAGGDKLAEARAEIARPAAKKAAKPWWRLF